MPAVGFWIFISSLVDRDLLIFASLVLILYCLYEKKHTFAALIFITSLGGVVLNKILKEIFQIPRPAEPLISVGGYAFPSGHAMSAAIFYSLLILLFHKKIKNKIARISFIIANISIILLVGLSRIMLRVHTAYDVVGGFVIGLLWLCIVYKIVQKINF